MEGWIIAGGIIAIVAGVACLGTFIPLTAIAFWHGWHTQDNEGRDGWRRVPDVRPMNDLAPWRRPAWKWGYRVAELEDDRDEWRAYNRDR